MFNLGMPELILVLVIALVVFGPGKLPEVGKALGRSLQEFKKATSEGDSKAVHIEPVPEKKDEPVMTGAKAEDKK